MSATATDIRYGEGLSTPAAIEGRLEQIDTELAEKQNEWELAALMHFRAKRDREKARASAFLTAKGSVAARNAIAEVETAAMGKEEEAAYESLKAGIRVRETRVSIGQSLLKSQGRA